MFSQEFLDRMMSNLIFRRTSKKKILDGGGQQSLSHSYKDVQRIDFALQRMEQGQYGLCTDCGCSIGEERLEIIPETPFCSQCAEEIESH